MIRVLRDAASLAAIITFVWAVCSLAAALEPFAMRGAA